MDKRLIIGVTGGLATGKTTVSDIFKKKGAVKIDADAITHELLKHDKKTIARILNLFGEKMLSGGKIDRKKLAGEVFPNKKKLKALCSVLHPVIIKRIKDEAKKYKRFPIVIDAPLLVEAGLDRYVDIVIVVTASRENQLKRSRKRGLSRKEAGRIIRNQMPLSQKKKSADYVIDSNKGINVVTKGVDGIWEKM